MIFFFYGKETLQPKEKTRELTARFLSKNPSGAGLTNIECTKETTVKDIKEALHSTSLFTQHRLVIITNLFIFPAQDQRTLAEGLDKLATQDVIIIWEKSIPRKNGILFKKLKSIADTSKEYKSPMGNKYTQWVARRLDKVMRGTKIKSDACAELINRVGNDMVRMNEEIIKLAVTVDGKVVTKNSVTSIVYMKSEANAFAAVTALFSSNRVRATALLSDQLRSGEDVFKLFGLYTYQVRTLLSVADCKDRGIMQPQQIANETGLNPFVISKSLTAIHAVPLSQLKKAHKCLINIDYDVKTGVRSMDEALYYFVATV